MSLYFLPCFLSSFFTPNEERNRCLMNGTCFEGINFHSWFWLAVTVPVVLNKQIQENTFKHVTINSFPYSMVHSIKTLLDFPIYTTKLQHVKQSHKISVTSYHSICPLSYLKAALKNSIIWHFYFEIFWNCI